MSGFVHLRFPPACRNDPVYVVVLYLVRKRAG